MGYIDNEQFNSLSGREIPYFIPPMNYAAKGGICLPCMVRETRIHNDSGSWKNDMQVVREFVEEPILEAVPIRQGRVGGPVLRDTTSRTTKWMKWETYSDALRFRIDYMQRIVSLWQIPIIDNYPGENVSAEKRLLMWFFGLFTGARECLKTGHIVKTGISLLAGIKPVSFYTTEDFEIRIVAEGTERALGPATIIQAEADVGRGKEYGTPPPEEPAEEREPTSEALVDVPTDGDEPEDAVQE